MELREHGWGPDGELGLRWLRDGGGFHRQVRPPGADVTDLPQEIQDEAAARWTQETKDAYEVKYPSEPEPPSASELRGEELRSLPEYQDLIEKLTTATPQQIRDYVDNNITNLAGARALFKRILVILAANISR